MRSPLCHSSAADARAPPPSSALGLGGGERERAAVAKRDALAQAKAAWLARDAAEGDAKAWVTRHTTGEVVLEGDLLGGKKARRRSRNSARLRRPS